MVDDTENFIQNIKFNQFTTLYTKLALRFQYFFSRHKSITNLLDFLYYINANYRLHSEIMDGDVRIFYT